MKHNFNQKGIAHILILALLLAGIVLGTHFVQQRNNILPRAQETDCPDLPFYCQDGQTRQCRGGYLDENGLCQRSCDVIEEDTLNCGKGGNQNDLSCSNLDKDWVFCTDKQATSGEVINNAGYMTGDLCQRKIYKWESRGSYESDSNGNCCSTPLTPAADQAECKIDAQNTSPSPVASLTTSSNSPSGSLQPGASATLACDEPKAASSYLNSKVAANLMHYYAIIKGTPEVCVKADLGLDPYLYAHPVDGDDERRLFICSGKDGSIKWRVVSGEGSSLAQTKEEFSKDINDLPNKENVEKAEKLLNISL